MDANDRAYFLRRILQEQEAARSAASAEARERHEELAAAYQFRCRLDGSATDSSGNLIGTQPMHWHEMAG